MTTGEAKVLVKDSIIFSADSIQNNLEINSDQQTVNPIKLEEGTNKINIKSRFARLKKSLRRRSVSIL